MSFGHIVLVFVVPAVVLVGACSSYNYVDTDLTRAKYIFSVLVGVGSLPLAYVGLWMASGQMPLFSLSPELTAGLALMVWAALYATLHLIVQEDKPRH